MVLQVDGFSSLSYLFTAFVWCLCGKKQDVEGSCSGLVIGIVYTL